MNLVNAICPHCGKITQVDESKEALYVLNAVKHSLPKKELKHVISLLKEKTQLIQELKLYLI